MTQPDDLQDLARQARCLAHRKTTASLATTDRDTGEAYCSFVTTACDEAGAPLLLLSDLAEHTKNIQVDNRCSLLFEDTAGLEHPLTGLRISLQIRLLRSDDPGHTARFLARHSDAELYAGFADFHFYAAEVSRVHLVGGFGVIHWIKGDDYLFPISEEFRDPDFQAGVTQHMNDDHPDAVCLLAGGSNTDWRMTGIDPEGMDFTRPGETARANFPTPIRHISDVRPAVVALTQSARARSYDT